MTDSTMPGAVLNTPTSAMRISYSDPRQLRISIAYVGREDITPGDTERVDIYLDQDANIHDIWDATKRLLVAFGIHQDNIDSMIVADADTISIRDEKK